PTRREQLERLRGEQFDVLVVGGGATGAGCALDAASRGLRTALVEMDDFGSGTSSRSTKLLHGGVRYLQKAIMNVDLEQYRMVREALNERANLLEIAPHLSYPLPIMLPVYKWWQLPYFYAGIKMYDLVAGSKCLKSSYVLSKRRALELFPMLKKDALVGAIVYYDGQHNDARMNVAIAITATRLGASVANHCRAVELLKGPTGEDGAAPRVVGAVCEDALTGERFAVRARCVINATGPFTDSLRQMDDATLPAICAPSAGVHVVLPGYYSPDCMGLLDPATSDGRVIFFLPWMKHTIAGTTDSPCGVTEHPAPSEEDITFILSEVRNYLSPEIEVRRGDVLSAWSGIRPLVSDPNRPDTQSIARNHVVHVGPSGLVTIAGGKWTTYRSMAEETVDAAVRAAALPASRCRTQGLLLEGAHDWTPNMYIRLVQDLGMDPEVAQHLADTYGDRAFAVAKHAAPTGKAWPTVGRRLDEEFPYLEAEVRYAVREYAATAVDVLGRRLRLAFLNNMAAEHALPRVVDILAEELGWSATERQKQLDEALTFLRTEMGQTVNQESRLQVPINLTVREVQTYTKRFQALDREKKGFISVVDLRQELSDLPGAQIHGMLSEVDPAHHGCVDLAAYMQIMATLKTGSPRGRHEHERVEGDNVRIPVERSGGGV
ncbi:LOW QUALITY PROTEIN: glycerol-3-phosphate dehydrogenase, mitochondrial-like, partial [Pollicipes pollicipes]|uniref:LOW QUALITY PROTEIN: glycerol-3-phosphate dehydrogenase, mitochondrial-like n=1 Tax=Pollicipes pollicipes TaxID=41117 RepID=UPI001885109A